MTNVSVDTTQTEKLLRLLDTVVIRLEGGTDEDLKVLDEKPVEPKQFDPPVRMSSNTTASASVISKNTDDDITAVKPPGRSNNPFAKKINDVTTKSDNDFNWKTSNPSSKVNTKNDDDDEDWDADSDDGKITTPNVSDEKKQEDDDDDDWSESKNAEPSSPDQKDQPSSPDVKQTNWDEEQSKASENEVAEIAASNPRKRSRSESSSSSSSSSDSDTVMSPPKPAKPQHDSIDEEISEPKDEEMKSVEEKDPTESAKDIGKSDEKLEDDAEKTNNDRNDVVDKEDDSKTEDKVETIDLDKESDTKDEGPVHKALHRTSSIFLRNLAPTITKAEVEAMCKRVMSNGFLRVAIADPLVERRWFRRGWSHLSVM